MLQHKRLISYAATGMFTCMSVSMLYFNILTVFFWRQSSLIKQWKYVLLLSYWMYIFSLFTLCHMCIRSRSTEKETTDQVKHFIASCQNLSAKTVSISQLFNILHYHQYNFLCGHEGTNLLYLKLKISKQFSWQFVQLELSSIFSSYIITFPY